jgi:hypothetical protein
MTKAPSELEAPPPSRGRHTDCLARRSGRFAVIVVAGVLLLSLRAWMLSRSTTRSQAAFGDSAAAQRIPPQQSWSPAPDPPPPLTFLEMGDSAANDNIVRDISLTPEGAGWRWTYLEPTLTFFLKNRNGQRFSMDFSIVETTFRDTGPVTLSCYINGRLLGQLHCPHAGDYRFEQAVPAEWLQGPQPTIVRAVLDTVWTAPTDRARLGYILIRAGFRK